VSPVALLFPGQGSQAVGMGRELAASSAAARRVFEEADDALGFALSRLCWDGPADELTQTRNAQPAILVHSVAAWRAIEDLGLDVRMAAGHSLGEFSAYVAAGAFGFGDAVRTVRLRGELMFDAGTRRPGRMAAVLGLDDMALDDVCREASTDREVVVAANYNAPGQIVISGDAAAVERAAGLAKAAGAKRVLPLNVSGAFHSPLMREAEEGLRGHLRAADIQPPRFPVVSNVTAQPVAEVGAARTLLVEQLTSPVRWVASVRTIRAAGISRFLELGPGNVLSGLLRRIVDGAEAHAVGTADQVDSFRAEAETWS
jgi:[acyl-carrier-protein] S-malonyltransferase